MRPIAPPDHAARAAQAAAPSPPKADPATLRAARDFEAIFVRKLLSSLEKTSKIAGAGSAGSDMYGTMMVGALADAVAAAGGIGLAPTIVKAMTPRTGDPPAPTVNPPVPGTPTSGAQGSAGASVPGVDHGDGSVRASAAGLARRVHRTADEG